MARTYKRDSRGRFAGGGGGNSGGSGGGKRGRPPGASGRKVGTRTQQKKAAAAQADRNRRFSSKATGAGRSAKAAYKAASSMARDVMSLPSQKRSAKATMTRMRNSRGTPPKPPARGGKVGSSTEQRRNAKAQAARTRQFSSKATGAGRSAKAAYKAARSDARFGRRAARMGGGRG